MSKNKVFPAKLVQSAKEGKTSHGGVEIYGDTRARDRVAGWAAVSVDEGSSGTANFCFLRGMTKLCRDNAQMRRRAENQKRNQTRKIWRVLGFKWASSVGKGGWRKELVERSTSCPKIPKDTKTKQNTRAQMMTQLKPGTTLEAVNPNDKQWFTKNGCDEGFLQRGFTNEDNYILRT